MDPKQRFSGRVENYIRYRPSYPAKAVDFIIQKFGITGASVIADIGSGTGIFTELLLNHAGKIYAVEPNPDMRKAAESLLCGYPAFVSVNGSSEATTLDSGSIDLITSAQSFHWFDREKSKIEFKRILKPEGKVLLLWNTRKTNTPILVEYEKLLKDHANDYKEIHHKNINDAAFKKFFHRGEFQKVVFEYSQSFEYQGLLGRVLSSSYCPLPGEEGYPLITTRLEEIFRKFNTDGHIEFNYDTEIYWGTV